MGIFRKQVGSGYHPWGEDRGLLRPVLLEHVTRSGPAAAQLFVLSFLALILVGALGFLFLPGLYTGQGLGLVDALFTAASAVCVTGLVVVDTATYFTPAGQAWIALLIQLGGLGILAFTTLIALSLGRRPALEVEEAVGEQARRVEVRRDPRAVLRAVLGVTVTAEAVGAILLWFIWRGELGAFHAIWPAVFHAVSAFCNAGFSVFSDSLTGFRGSPATLLVVAGLIIVGGLGFVVIQDLHECFVRRERRRLTLHSRVVLVSTVVLVVAAAVIYLVLESSHALVGLGWIDKVVNAAFMSVTARTAGFNTVDYNALSNTSIFLTMALMLIGGSPNSTAGGLKTTTIALLGLALLARLRGERSVSAFGRSIPPETVQRAAGVVTGAMVLLVACILLLLVTGAGLVSGTDRAGMVRAAFEAHSAFGTVGLSMGMTSSLSEVGRIVMIGLMFFGRIGPPTVVAAMALAWRRRQVRYRLAHEDVLIG